MLSSQILKNVWLSLVFQNMKLVKVPIFKVLFPKILYLVCIIRAVNLEKNSNACIILYQ